MAVSLQGFEQLDKRFQALTAVAKFDALSKALTAGAKPVKESAASRAPRDTGKLAANMTTKLSLDRDIHEATIFIGPGKNEFYGYFIEFGTGASFERAAARALGYPAKSKGGRSRKSQPFLRPALESTQKQTTSEMLRVLEKEIRKAETA